MRTVQAVLTERMDMMKRQTRLWKRAVLLLLAISLLALTACSKEGQIDDPGTPGPATGSADDFSEAPEGFVDNEIDPDEYTEDELYFTDAEKDTIIGVNDETVYFNGTGMQSRFAVNMISSGTGAVAGLPIDAIKDRVDYIKFGDIRYKLDQLVRPRTEGFAVLEMMAADFGVDIYGSDENGTVYLLDCAGKELAGDELREAYSERADFDDYTVCVYYLHCRMSGMDESDHERCREILSEKYDIDHSSALDGTLAVMLYYDTTGHDLFYAVAAAAPDYWTDPEDFEANMDSHSKHDITNCCMVLDGDHPVGFVNQVFIRCDQDQPFSAGETESDDMDPNGNAVE